MLVRWFVVLPPVRRVVRKRGGCGRTHARVYARFAPGVRMGVCYAGAHAPASWCALLRGCVPQ